MLRPRTISVVLAAASHVLYPWHFQRLFVLHQHPSTNCRRPQEQILSFVTRFMHPKRGYLTPTNNCRVRVNIISILEKITTASTKTIPRPKSSTEFHLKKKNHRPNFCWGLSISKSYFAHVWVISERRTRNLQ